MGIRHQPTTSSNGTHQPRPLDVVLKHLRGGNLSARVNAVLELGELRDPRTLMPLTDALSDDAPEVRRAAAWALGELGDARAVRALAMALNDSDDRTRRSVLTDYFQEHDSQPERAQQRVCDVAAEALARIGTADAQAALARWRESD